MIRRRTTMLMAATGAAMVALALWRSPLRDEAGRLPAPRPAFPGLEARLDGLARVEIIAGGNRATLLRAEPGGWGVAEQHGYRLLAPRLRALLAGLVVLRVTEDRGADPALHARLGLAEPAAGNEMRRVRLLDAGGAVLLDALLGPERGGQGLVPPTRLLLAGDRPRALLAEGRIALDADPDTWLDRELALLAPDRLRRVEVARLGEPPLVLARAGEVDAPLVIEAPTDAAAPNPLVLQEVGRAFDALTFTAIRPEADAPGAPLGQAVFRYSADVTITVTARGEEGGFWVLLRAEGGPEAQALDARWRGWAHGLSSWRERALLPRLSDLVPG